MLACPIVSWTTLGLVPTASMGVAQVPEVVEMDAGKPCALKPLLGGPVHEVVVAHGRAYPRRAAASKGRCSAPHPRASAVWQSTCTGPAWPEAS